MVETCSSHAGSAHPAIYTLTAVIESTDATPDVFWRCPACCLLRKCLGHGREWPACTG